jgi:hypothetical protein
MNEATENQIVKNAVNLIFVKYSECVKSNSGVLDLLTKTDTVVKFMDEEPFLKNLMLSEKPKVGCKVNGFTDYLTGTPIIFINRGSCTPATVIHELLHFLSHKNFNEAFAPEFIEGITEYFTRKVQGRAADKEPFKQFKVDRSGIYDSEFSVVQFGRTMISKNHEKDARQGYMKRAYFLGDKDAILLLKQYTG